MKKLRLDPEVLRVETFEPRDREAKEETVQAQDGTWHGETCVTQCVTGHCDCMFSYPADGCW